MDVDKPVCLECGCTLDVSWHLYCDRCYRELWHTKVVPLSKDADGNYVVKDKSGRVYRLYHERWVRVSKQD